MPNKKVFLVGINDYVPSGTGGPDLNGCVGDAEDMANTLTILGFESKNMRICTNRRATKAGIVKGLQWLMKNAGAGDSLVFYYSGHGSQVPDLDGDEIDRKDEIICPHDISFENQVYIKDDDFKGLFKTLPAGVVLEVILDSCHSGTGTRDIPVSRRSKYLPPPLDYSFHIDYNPVLKTAGILKFGASTERRIKEGLNHVLWSGCRDNQTSEETEIEGKVRGVFTYNFCQILRRTNGNITRKELHKLLTGAVRRGGFAQVPQLEASSAKLLEKPFV